MTGDKGESVYYQSVNKQADIFPESRGMGATSLRELRFIPWQVAADKLQLLKSEANTATLQMGDATIAVDLETGFVNSWISESPEGLARMEHLQFGPVHYPEGIVFPTVVFHNAYSHGVLARVQAFIIEDARFNVDLAESTFSVNSPAQTVVVDYRRSDDNPAVTRIASPAADLVEALEEQVKSQQVRHARGLRGEWSLVIVAIFAVASAAAGAALWLRHTKEKS